MHLMETYQRECMAKASEGKSSSPPHQRKSRVTNGKAHRESMRIKCVYGNSNIIRASDFTLKAYSVHCSVSSQVMSIFRDNGAPIRYVKLWVAHAPGMPGTFCPPPGERSRHASPHGRNGLFFQKCTIFHKRKSKFPSLLKCMEGSRASVSLVLTNRSAFSVVKLLWISITFFHILLIRIYNSKYLRKSSKDFLTWRD